MMFYNFTLFSLSSSTKDYLYISSLSPDLRLLLIILFENTELLSTSIFISYKIVKHYVLLNGKAVLLSGIKISQGTKSQNLDSF